MQHLLRRIDHLALRIESEQRDAFAIEFVQFANHRHFDLIQYVVSSLHIRIRRRCPFSESTKMAIHERRGSVTQTVQRTVDHTRLGEREKKKYTQGLR